MIADLNKIRNRHEFAEALPYRRQSRPTCYQCNKRWPCDAIILLGAVEELVERLTEGGG